MALFVVILTTIAGILALVVREIVSFTRQRAEYSKRRLVLRLTTAALIIFLLASVLIAIRAFGLDHETGDPVFFLAFWCCVALLTGGILCLALADFTLVGTELRRAANRHWQEIAELIAAKQREKEKGESGPID